MLSARSQRLLTQGLCTSCKTRKTREGKRTCQRCLVVHRPRVLDHHRKMKYGITPEDMQMLRDSQNNCCAICKKFLDRACVDHDHSTEGEDKRKAVRGLLCGPCNTAIGLLGDSVLVLEAAILYLQDPPAKQVLM